MAFSETRLPARLAFGSTGGVERRTDIVQLASGYEQRSTPWADGRRRYLIGGGVRAIAEAQALVAFFEARRGRLNGFRFQDFADFSSAAPGDAVTALDQPIGTGDGATTVFQLAKTYGEPGDPEAYVRPIKKPVAGTVLVAVAGSALAPSAFAVDATTGLVTLTAAPAAGQAVTVGFQFDVPVRFDADRIDMTLESFEAARLMAVPLIEIRGLMRALPSGLLDAIDSGAATLATAWILTRADGVKLGFTDHDRDLTVEGVTCAAATGWTAGAAETDLGVKAGTVATTGALDSAAITEADIAAGRYDGAGVEAWRLDWTAPAYAVLLWRGTIARLVRTGSAFTAEIEGPLWALQRSAGRTFSKLCDARLGDGRCRLDVSGAAFNGAGAVSASSDDRRLTVSGLDAFAAGWFANGLLTWTDGANTGAVQTVAGHLTGDAGVVLVLEEAALQSVAAEDAFTVRAGCDKRFTTCDGKFANISNFQGFPDIPGDDFLAVNAATAVRTDGSSRRTS